ncbi:MULTISPECIES: DUF4142 domain-containing protein [Cupriavidus]|uniref:DUF4142 domain-containing protein n=1 Tax=Cupriavidus pauculus TaxID=82633 RepID=A0A5P2H935_9BURK|nr:DUF4142 domain-containing protein [Cupriavidus pauculus]QET04476.1 DUF4142 domain-containing protein [Cupriavidus pauculus]
MATLHTVRAAVAASALLFAAAAGAQGTNTTAPKTASPNAMPTAGATQGSELARGDRTFLENAAQGGHAEIEGSKLANQKSANADVKAFASRMIQDHTKVGDELTSLARSKGYTPPTEPSLVQKGELKALGVLDGSKFDKMYSSRIGVAAHENTVKMFREASQNAKDADVKAFATKQLPALEQHLQMARDLDKKVGNG